MGRKKYLDVWNGNESTCNHIRGRDSSIYPPFNNESSVFDIFNTDICRIVHLTADGTSKYEDVEGMVLRMSINEMSNDGDKECYCTKQTLDLNGKLECLPVGFADMHSCIDAPALTSYPHMFWADDAYSTTVNGLEPDQEKHQTFVVIEPISRLEVGTPQYNRWKEPQHPSFLNVYLFNLTNSDLVTNTGSKPVVEEIGPYVYRQHRSRSNVIVNVDDTLSYTRFKNFEFDSEASGSYQLNDSLRVLNVPLLATLQMFEMLDNLTAFDQYWRPAFNIADDETDYLFRTISVGQYLFDGYEFCTNSIVQIFCNDLRSLLAESKMFRMTETGIAFSFFDYRNGEDGHFEIFSGINQISDLGRIQRWNNNEHMDAWVPESICNQVRGTDATIFPPFNDQNSNFDVLYSDICRVFNLVHDHEINFKEIYGNRYILKAAAFSSLSPNRWCHCINITTNLDGENTCLPNGFEDMYGCLGTHLVLSFPHLLWADHTYMSTVDGLNRSQTQHISYVDLEPQLGIPLRTAKRMQYNMFLRNNTNITQYVTPSVIPILWFEEVTNISQDLVDDTINSFLNWILALEVVTWVLVGVGATILVISIIGCLCCR